MFLLKQKTSSMEQEIYQQATILENLLKIHVNNGNIDIDIPFDIEKIVIVASGSSYHCARYAADLFGNISGIEARAIYSSEFLLKSAVPHEREILYIFITQSGETSDTNLALKKAKEYGMRTLCITNKKDSTIWQAADYKVDCYAGEEKSIAATKSLTAQMLVCTLLVLKYATIKGIDVKSFLSELDSIAESIEQAYSQHNTIKKVAAYLSKFRNIVITADGISYAIAKEASLKIKETSYINVYSNILGEFMHGHVAVLNNKPAFIHISVDDLSYSAIKNLKKICEDYHPPLCIMGSSNKKLSKFSQFQPFFESFCKKFYIFVSLAKLPISFFVPTLSNMTS